MIQEYIERCVVERVLRLSSRLAAAEVIVIIPMAVPDEQGVQGEAYVGLVVIGAGALIPQASVVAATARSFTGSVHESTYVSQFFASHCDGRVGIYLDHEAILRFFDLPPPEAPAR